MVQMMVMISLRMFIRAPIMVTGSIALMFIMNTQLAKIVLLILPLTLVLSIIFLIIINNNDIEKIDQ
jgi:ABC-type multidrug transport system fused ATPase/permease subunit